MFIEPNDYAESKPLIQEDPNRVHATMDFSIPGFQWNCRTDVPPVIDV
jgi:hypothetical protein